MQTHRFLENSNSDIYPSDDLIRLLFSRIFLIIVSTMFPPVSCVIISCISTLVGILTSVFPIIYLRKPTLQGIFKWSPLIVVLCVKIYALWAVKFIFSCIACFELVTLLSTITEDASLFETANSQLIGYFYPEIRNDI